MASPVDTLSVSDITWLKAMESAARSLMRAEEFAEKYSKKHGFQGSWIAENAAHTQAWIAFAREITMHARAAQ
jgi:hypothetical protein